MTTQITRLNTPNPTLGNKLLLTGTFCLSLAISACSPDLEEAAANIPGPSSTQAQPNDDPSTEGVESENTNPNSTDGQHSTDTDTDTDSEPEETHEPTTTSNETLASTCPDDAFDADNDGIIDCVKQGGKLPAAVTDFRTAVIVVDFSDTDTNTRSLFPTSSELSELIFSPTSDINNYLRAMSYGKFDVLEGDVFGPFTHPNTISDMVTSGAYNSSDYLESHLLQTGNAIQIPGFDADNYDAITFIAYDDYSWNPGGLTGEWTFTINNQTVTKDHSIVMALNIGYRRRDTNAPFYNLLNDTLRGSVFVPETIHSTGEIQFEHTGHNLGEFERTFIHELVHSMGIQTHANSAFGDNTFVSRPDPNSSNYHLNEGYGNKSALMGTSEHGVAMTSAYRDYLGWYDDDTQLEIKDFGNYQVTVFPDSSQQTLHSVEIRLPYQVSEWWDVPSAEYLNKGFFLEVHSIDVIWDSPLTHPQLTENGNGVMISFTDGFTSWQLDASPSEYLAFSWGTVPDRRDLVLKPGMTFETEDVLITCLGKIGDGYQLSIEVKSH